MDGRQVCGEPWNSRSRFSSSNSPSPEADGAGRAGQHDHPRVQQRADDDHQLRQDGHAAQGRRHPREVLREDPRRRPIGRRRSPTRVLGMARNRSAGQEPTDLAQLVEDTLLLLEREMNKYRITVEKSSSRSRRPGQRQPDPAGAAEPADQRPAGDAQRRPAAGSSCSTTRRTT